MYSSFLKLSILCFIGILSVTSAQSSNVQVKSSIKYHEGVIDGMLSFKASDGTSTDVPINGPSTPISGGDYDLFVNTERFDNNLSCGKVTIGQNMGALKVTISCPGEGSYEQDCAPVTCRLENS